MPKVVAFAVMAHQDPEMLRRLVAELTGYPVVVHIDAKADIASFQPLPGARFVQDRVNVTWGGFSQVEATLRTFRDCLDELGDEQDAAIALLSGSDFPVRPIDEFQRYVDEVPWTEHIRAVPLLDGFRPLANRIRRRWFFDLLPPLGMSRWKQRRNAVLRRFLSWALPRRSLNAYRGLTPAVSSQWILLSRGCLEDILPTAHDRGFQRLFRRTYAPDELFFATLVHSGRWSAQTEFGGLEPRHGKSTTEFPNFHYVDPSLAVWLDTADAPDVAASGAYFARKLRSANLDEFLEAVRRERAALPAVPDLRGFPTAGRGVREDA